MKRLFCILVFMLLIVLSINGIEENQATLVKSRKSQSVMWNEIETDFVYVVQPWDSLRKIAARFLGDANRWGEILKSNKIRSGNPDLIYPMEVFVIREKTKTERKGELVYLNGRE